MAAVRFNCYCGFLNEALNLVCDHKLNFGGDFLRIIVNEDAAVDETEIIVNCRKGDGDIFKMLAILRSFDQKLTGTKDGRTFVLNAMDVIYCDSVDKKTFIYTMDAVYESPLRLYELEERLSFADFFRAVKHDVFFRLAGYGNFGDHGGSPICRFHGSRHKEDEVLNPICNVLAFSLCHARRFCDHFSMVSNECDRLAVVCFNFHCCHWNHDCRF